MGEGLFAKACVGLCFCSLFQVGRSGGANKQCDAK